MGWGTVVLQLSLIVSFVAMFFTLPAFHDQREQLTSLFSTCPLHWFSGKNGDMTIGHSEQLAHAVIHTGSDKLFTNDELRQLDGSEGSSGLCLAVLGSVYDVSAGGRHYGPGGSYQFLAAKDASRAFVSGDFSESGLSKDLSSLTPAQWLELLHWFQFYEKSKTYHYIGKLVGSFYDNEGMATDALKAAQSAIEDALVAKQRDDYQLKIFPPCNSQWSEAAGTTVWCSDRSGGIARDWNGVPRKFFDSVTQRTRCVCVRTTGAPSDASLPDSGNGDLGHPNLREYDSCPSLSDTCAVV